MAFKKIDSIVFFRASLFLALLLLISLVLLTLTAVQVGEKLQVRAQFFSVIQDAATLHEFSQLKTFSSMDAGVRDKGVIDEMLARYYLELRYEQVPDSSEMVYRWGRGSPVYLLSSPKLYNEFVGDLEGKIDHLSDAVVSVDIKRVERDGNVFTIYFDVYELTSESPTPRYQSKKVVLEFRYVPSRVRYSSIFSNPYGLTFIRFEESGKKSTVN